MKRRNALVTIVLLLAATAASDRERAWYVENIAFAGNDSIGPSELFAQMELRPAEFFTRMKYSLSTLIDDLERIKRLYRARGYLDACVTIAGIERDTATRGVEIRLRIDEGRQTIVSSIVFECNEVFGDSALSRFVPLRAGAPFDSLLYAQSARAIEDSLAWRGYLFAEVERGLEIFDTVNRATILFRVAEGPVARRGDLEIEGTDDVRRSVIEREVTPGEGEILTSREIARSISRLYGTGLFDYVRIEPSDTAEIPMDADTLTVPVLVEISMADMFSFQAGGGYNTDDGLYGTVESSYANLFALGHRITASAIASFDLIGAQIVYSYPWIFGVPLFGDFTAYIRRRDEIDFTGLFSGGLFALSGRLSSRNGYRTWLQIENTAWLRGAPPVPDVVLEEPGNIVLLGAGFTHDSRDAALIPRKGIFSYVQAELAGPGIPWSDKFYKLAGDARSYFSILNKSISFGTALFAGYIDGYGEEGGAVPVQELFRAGEDGVRPVRGYEEEEVTIPDTDKNIHGGKLALIITPLEVTFPIYAFLMGAVFLDGGFIWPTPGEFAIDDIKWAAGPGIRLTLPIAVRLDYGFRLDGDPDQVGRFHFGIGGSF